MWFSPPAPPDYLFVCQVCKHTRRYTGSEIADAIWNFRACKACRTEKLPYALPIGNTARQNDVIVSENAPAAGLRPAGTPLLPHVATQLALQAKGTLGQKQTAKRELPHGPVRGLFDVTFAEAMESGASGTWLDKSSGSRQ